MAVNILYTLRKKLFKINRSLTGDHVSIQYKNYINGRIETCHIIIIMYMLCSSIKKLVNFVK